MGSELYGKTLGLIGAAHRQHRRRPRQGAEDEGHRFRSVSVARARRRSGYRKGELAELLPRADFITLHTPLTAETKNIISADAINKMKKGARLINCARGGLVDEAALKVALDSGHLAGAALDVFEEEPAKTNALFGNEKVVATPHLGASTAEAQENVALQVAEQIADYLLTGAIINALNMPSISAQEAQKVRPWIALAEKLGLFAGQVIDTSIQSVEILYEGTAAELNQRALTQAVLAGLLRPALSHVNMVNAPVIAKDRGIKVSETRRPQQGVYDGYIKVTATVDGGSTRRRVAGTVFSDGRPRLIQVRDINLDAEFAPNMLFVHQRGQTGLHRPAGHFARRCESQHRRLRARPQRAGRGRDLPGRGRWRAQ